MTDQEIRELFINLEQFIKDYDSSIITDIVEKDGLINLYTSIFVFSYDYNETKLKKILIYTNILIPSTELIHFYDIFIENFNKNLFLLAEDFCFDDNGIMLFGSDAVLKNMEFNYNEYTNLLHQLKYSTVQ